MKGSLQRNFIYLMAIVLVCSMRVQASISAVNNGYFAKLLSNDAKDLNPLSIMDVESLLATLDNVPNSKLGFTSSAVYEEVLGGTGPTDDFDGDGVLNQDDLDDDNDGILDDIENECPGSKFAEVDLANSSLNSSFTANSSVSLTLPDGTTVTGTESDSGAYFNDGTTLADNSVCYFGTEGIYYKPEINTDVISTVVLGGNHSLTYTFSQPVTDLLLYIEGLDRRALTISGTGFTSLEKLAGNSQTVVTANMVYDLSIGGPGVGVHNSDCGEQNLSVEGTVRLKGTYSSLTFSFSNNSGSTYGDRFEMNFAQELTCDVDTDNDTFTNNFDTDSDDDGCPDAIEGSAFLNYSVLDGNNALIGPVDANGVPLLANGGQGIGTSIDKTLSSGICKIDCSYGASTDGRPTLNDVDGDGIANYCDDDDDNDGILDLVENTSICESHSMNYSLYGKIDGARDRLAPDDLNRDYIFGDFYGFHFDFRTYRYLYPADVSILIDVTIGDDNNARNGTVTVDGVSKNVSTTAGNFQTVTFNPDLNYSYDVLIEGLDVSLTNIVIKRPDGTILTQFDFGLTGSPVAADFNEISVGLNSVTNYPSGNVIAACRGSNLDSDGDVVPDYQDVDSDNDGCPDALEGGSSITFDKIDPNTLRLAGSVDGKGVPVVDGANQTIGSSKEISNQSDQCNTCSAAISSKPDADADGLIDECDLDSDNDGILNSNECYQNNLSYTLSSDNTGSVIGNADLSVTLTTDTGEIRPSQESKFTLGETNPFASVGSKYTLTFNQPVNDLDLIISNINFLSHDSLTIVGNFVIEQLDGTVNQNVDFSIYDGKANPIKIEYDKGGTLYHAIQPSILGGRTQAGATLDFMGLNNLETNPIQRVTFELLQNISGTDLVFFAEPIVTIYCDTDKDGIPDYLDLDSDGDGCPDAIEGGADFTFSVLKTSTLPGGNSGNNYIGTSDEPVVYNLGKDSGSEGIPLLADQSIGQSRGIAFDPDQKACNDVIAEDDVNFTIPERPVSGNIFTNDYDPDNDNFSLTKIDLDGDGVPESAASATVANEVRDSNGKLLGQLLIDPSNGQYTFTPAAGVIGDIPIAYEICDEGNPQACDTAVLEIVIKTPTKREGGIGPVAINDDAETAPSQPVTIPVLANDSDIDGQIVPSTVSLDASSVGQSCTTVDADGDCIVVIVPGEGTWNVNPDGTITFSPEDGFTGDTQPITYEVEDDDANADTATIVVTVNDSPSNSTAAADDSNIGYQGESLQGNLLVNDTDKEGDTQEVTLIDTNSDGIPDTATSGGPQDIFQNGVKVGVLSVNPTTGDYDWTPEPDFVGTVNIAYTACDDNVNQACDNATLVLANVPLPVAAAEPDFTPVLQLFTQRSIDGPTSVFILFDVNEVSGAAGSTGPLTLRMAKTSFLNFNYDADATEIGGITLSNKDWVFDDSDPFDWKWTTTQNIAADGSSTEFGFIAVFDSKGAVGSQELEVQIPQGSGGDSNIANNKDFDTVTYK